MAKRFCLVCGAVYDYCTCRRENKLFRYQDVACCPEHAVIYFERQAQEQNGEKEKNEEL